MRIIAGKLGGRPLKSLPGGETRPAMAKTRAALFSILTSSGIDWTDAHALDLYAGTGSLAFEALSRGAAKATLVDFSRSQTQLIAHNATLLGVMPQCEIITMDVLRFLRKINRSYNLIFIDPPYRRNLGQKSIEETLANGCLASGGFLAAELEAGTEIPPVNGLIPLALRQFGQTILHIWKKE